MEEKVEVTKGTGQQDKTKEAPAAVEPVIGSVESTNSELELRRAPYQLIGLIGDLDSVVGFLLGGLGEKTIKSPSQLQESETNVFIVDKDTEEMVIEESLRTMLRRTDIGMVFVTRLVADRIRSFLSHRTQVYPIILEIPSPLDPFKFEDAEEQQCQKNLVPQKRKKQ